jgi:hypothetical protein
VAPNEYHLERQEFVKQEMLPAPVRRLDGRIQREKHRGNRLSGQNPASAEGVNAGELVLCPLT